MKRTLLILAALCALSCSVKEERGDCPCVLTLFADKAASWELRVPESATVLNEGVDYPVSLRAVVGGSLSWRDDGAFADGTDSESIKVGKGQASVSYYSRPERAVEGTDGLTVATGEQWDRLYMGRASIDCSGETASDTLEFHKEYCALWLRIVKLPVDGKTGYGLSIESDVVGINPMTAELLKGEFRCTPDEISEGLYRAILPRQREDSLIALVLSFTDIGGEKRLPLWTEILSSGYDWSEPDLGDIFLTVNLADAEASARVVDWATSEVDVTL